MLYECPYLYNLCGFAQEYETSNARVVQELEPARVCVKICFDSRYYSHVLTPPAAFDRGKLLGASVTTFKDIVYSRRAAHANVPGVSLRCKRFL